MKTPMTRRALHAAVRPYREALVNFFATQCWPRPSLPQVLIEAGFSVLPERERGCWRAVVLGPGIVVKTGQQSIGAPPAYHPVWRHRRAFVPTIRLGNNLIAQPRGVIMAHYKAGGVVWQRYMRAVKIVDRHILYNDNHTGNFARFPDGSVRCIDY